MSNFAPLQVLVFVLFLFVVCLFWGVVLGFTCFFKREKIMEVGGWGGRKDLEYGRGETMIRIHCIKKISI